VRTLEGRNYPEGRRLRVLVACVRAKRLRGGWGVCAVLALIALALPASANARRPVTSVDENGWLHLESNKGPTINERGTGSGSFACNVYISLTLRGTQVTATYSAYPHGGGSIIGTATAQIHKSTETAASFTGTITLKSGTGSYAHPSGTGSFDGTINRKSYAMNLRVAGRMRL
jgi:hypothetical protein